MVSMYVNNFFEYRSNPILECITNIILYVDMFQDDHPTNRIGRWYKPWFYKHVESFLTNQQQIDKEKFTEYIPTVDYFHRHNRAYFWLMVNQLSCANDAWFR